MSVTNSSDGLPMYPNDPSQMPCFYREGGLVGQVCIDNHREGDSDRLR